MKRHDGDGGNDEAMRREILAYLNAHPRAADTAVGACGWWIESSTSDGTVERVRRVLDRSAAKGRVRRTKIVGGRVVYSARV